MKQHLCPKTNNALDETVVGGAKSAKKGLVLILLLLAVALLLSACSLFDSGIAGTYIGTHTPSTGMTMEMTIVIKSDKAYSMKVKNLNTGTTTYNSAGTYAIVGADSSTIIFTNNAGTHINGTLYSREIALPPSSAFGPGEGYLMFFCTKK
jgi:hypothetical protein